MIFLTVGAHLGFDRMVRAVDGLVAYGMLDEPVFAHIGQGAYEPVNFEYQRTLQKRTLDNLLRGCSAVITHAAPGIISAAMVMSRPMLVMPRLKEYGECRDNSQLQVAEKFNKAGLVLAAYSDQDLPMIVHKLKIFKPASSHANIDTAVNRISAFIHNLEVAL